MVEHLEAVREGCEVFGQKIGAAHLAGMAGLLHDMGKNTNSFREYISKAVENPNHPPAKGSVDHSTAGGKWIYERYHSLKTSEDKIVAEWIANCVISHHQGLRDYFSPEGESPFLDRVVKKREGMEEYGQAVAAFLTEWPIPMLDDYYGHAKKELRQLAARRKKMKLSEFSFSLLIKYIFSCLIDADRTDSRQFEEGRREGWSRDHSPFFQRSYEALLQHLEAKNKGDHAEHPINQLRRSMSEACDRFASNPSGIYTLSIPTGGGKTLASLRYALKHAVEHGKERIIYIVPYTTVIEQNASEIRSILNEDDQILEHHSNVIDQFDPVSSAKDYDLAKERLSLARDNWDRPLIFYDNGSIPKLFLCKRDPKRPTIASFDQCGDCF
ncbi:CRISPR-associated endonuclease Cas3'' [Gorillibacterium sp. CAU 1737]|uniref:CRISPR-associated endonuclease Cas3'' n=1 Tax=Gorillibacterium sp. CAU 1737 TaxID=3140362 RepID=UPI003260C660